MKNTEEVDGSEYMVLEKRTKRINQLALKAKAKHQDNKASEVLQKNVLAVFKDEWAANVLTEI